MLHLCCILCGSCKCKNKFSWIIYWPWQTLEYMWKQVQCVLQCATPNTHTSMLTCSCSIKIVCASFNTQGNTWSIPYWNRFIWSEKKQNKNWKEERKKRWETSYNVISYSSFSIYQLISCKYTHGHLLEGVQKKWKLNKNNIDSCCVSFEYLTHIQWNDNQQFQIEKLHAKYECDRYHMEEHICLY